MKPSVQIIILVIVLSTIFGGLSGVLVLKYQSLSQDELIKNFYLTENAVNISPHGLRGKMDKGIDDFILVDLRSPEEYEREHIISAINIPAYKDPETSAYGDTERIIGSFSELSKDKEIIVYCYSMPCMTGRKIGKMLAENGIFVKHLGVGWNEWRYFWTLWNHEHEWDVINVEDYIASGQEPGVPAVKENPKGCPIEGDFGC